MHGVTEHGEARGHGGEEALVLVLVLVLVGATHLRSLTLKPETPIRRRSEKKGLRSVRERERERERDGRIKVISGNSDDRRWIGWR